MEKQESLMSFNQEEGRIQLQYAWTEDILQLTDNKSQAIGYQRSVERKLRKSGDLDWYNQEIQDQLSKGYLVELKEQDVQTYTGPISYVGHHPVYKDSKTTPVRAVCHSSLKNKNCGLSPNECVPKPPNALANLLEVFFAGGVMK